MPHAPNIRGALSAASWIAKRPAGDEVVRLNALLQGHPHGHHRVDLRGTKTAGNFAAYCGRESWQPDRIEMDSSLAFGKCSCPSGPAAVVNRGTQTGKRWVRPLPAGSAFVTAPPRLRGRSPARRPTATHSRRPPDLRPARWRATRSARRRGARTPPPREVSVPEVFGWTSTSWSKQRVSRGLPKHRQRLLNCLNTRPLNPQNSLPARATVARRRPGTNPVPQLRRDVVHLFRRRGLLARRERGVHGVLRHVLEPARPCQRSAPS